MSEPFTSLPLASHRFSSFCEKDGISDLTASLSSYVLALIGDKVRAPSRMGHDKQGLFKINQGKLGEGWIGGTVWLTFYQTIPARRIARSRPLWRKEAKVCTLQTAGGV